MRLRIRKIIIRPCHASMADRKWFRGDAQG